MNAAAWDFHPITLALPFISVGILSVALKRFKWLLFCCMIILLCKEHLGGMVAGFGVLWWLKHRETMPAAGLLVLGICHSVLVLGFIMPSLSPTGEHIMFGADMGHLSRYVWLGQTPQEIFWTLLTHPLKVTEFVIITKGGWLYLALLILPFVGLPLIGLEFLLPSMADLAANMLSTNPLQQSPFSYHSAAIIPFLTAAAIYGSQRLHRKIKRYSLHALAGFCLVISAYSGYFFSPFLSLPGSASHWAPHKFLNFPDPRLKEITAQLPDDAPVSAQANIGAHFSQRKEIFLYPNNIEKSQAIILNMQSPTTRVEAQNPGMVGALTHHLQMSPSKYLKSIEVLLLSGEWGISYWNDPWLLLSRGGHSTVPYNVVMDKIEILREEWRINR